MNINLHNIEELLFFDRGAQARCPELKPLFDQWYFSRRAGLQSQTNKVLLEGLNALTAAQLAALREYFGEEIFVEKLDNDIVKNYEGPLEGDGLCLYHGHQDFGVSRDKDRLFITFWR